MFDQLPSLQLTLTVLGWVAICYAIPRELMRRYATQHYIEWVIRGGAYWHRASDKWVVGDRIFYTDELWWDVLVCFVGGTLLNQAFVLLLSEIGSEYFAPPILKNVVPFRVLCAASISSSLLLFITRLYDRCHLADEAIAQRQLIDPNFSAANEMHKLLDGKSAFIRRVIGRDSEAQQRPTK